ncbi:MAG: thioredoxin domain-containing protein, partial [Pirellulaceae bacterium]|nr:thioredoxin domain-containing protein [Pirellulaceae bacterium]
PFGTPLTIASIGLAGFGTAALIVGQIFAEEPPKFTIIDHEEQTQEEATEGSDLSAPADDEFFAPPLEEDGEMFEAPAGDDNDTAAIGSRASFQGAASLLGMFSTTTVLSYQPQEEAKQEEAKQEEKKQKSGEQVKKKPERRMVSVKGNLRLDPRQWPLLGSPDAKYIFVELYDYACPHCRATHRAIEGACETMGDDLAVIVLPVPLNTNCNSAITRTGANFGQSCELAKLAVACWKLDPQRFEEFHHWMFKGTACPRYAQAKAKADELLGRENVDAELRKEAAGKYISKHVQLYKRIGKGVVPKLLFPTTTVEGEFTSPTALVDLVQKRAK